MPGKKSQGYLLYLTRRILGIRGTRMLRNFIGDLLIDLRFVPSADSVCREECVSAMMRVKDEEWWIEPSILSIKDLVDEYVIIDQSRYDRTPEIIDEVKDDYGLNIIHIRDFTVDFVEVSNKALRSTKCKWILRWDGDYVAREELISTIKALIQNLDRRKYYNIYWPHISFEVDLFHINIKNPLHIKHWLVTWSPKVRFIPLKYFEFLYTPPYHKRIDINKPLSLHLRTVKPPVRLLEWKYWWEMRMKGILGKVELYEYIKQRIKEDFGVEDLHEASLKFLTQLRNRNDIGKYDPSIWGDYPKILKDYVRRRFNIVL
jgi:hypothetical protein